MIRIKIISAFVFLLSFSGEAGILPSVKTVSAFEIKESFYPEFQVEIAFVSVNGSQASNFFQKARTFSPIKKVILFKSLFSTGLAIGYISFSDFTDTRLDIPGDLDSKPVISDTFFFLVYKLLASSFIL